ncbi:MAG: aminotransferase class IV [Oligoflexales bacterium]
MAIVSVNGVITKADDAQISALDRGFLFGENIFETFVAFGSKVLDIPQHLTRLRSSAERFGIDIPWRDEEFAFELEAIASQLQAPKASIRLVVTSGLGLQLHANEKLCPQRMIYAAAALSTSPEIYSTGIALQKVSSEITKRQPSAKTGNYVASRVAVRKAKQQKFEDVLWVNGAQEVTEASTANIFFIGRHGDQIEIATPSLHSGILEGITRRRILSLLENAGIGAHETIISSDELPRFDEAFVCSTVRGLVPVRQVGTQKFHTCRKEATYWLIERLYLTSLECELGYRPHPATGRPTDSASSTL